MNEISFCCVCITLQTIAAGSVNLGILSSFSSPHPSIPASQLVWAGNLSFTSPSFSLSLSLSLTYTYTHFGSLLRVCVCVTLPF